MVNKLMRRRLEKLGKAKFLNFEDIRNPFILNDFCISSPNGTWKLADDVEIIPCEHEQKTSWVYNLLPKFFSDNHYQ